PLSWRFPSGRDRRRSGDLPLFRRTLCRLSYPTKVGEPPAVPTGFEPAASGLTGRRALQTAPRDQGLLLCTPNGIRTRAATLKGWCPRPLDEWGSFPRGSGHASSPPPWPERAVSEQLNCCTVATDDAFGSPPAPARPNE